jgi:cold shock protein
MQGTVKFFNEDRGFGFIAPDAGGNDVFVHIREAQRSGIYALSEGQKVSFDVLPDRRSGKPAAANLSIIK